MRLLLVTLLLLLVPAGAAGATVLGVYSEDELSGSAALRNTAAASQQATGFASVRQPWSWKLLEPSPGVFDWAGHDAAVAAAALHGMTILPYLIEPPAWAVDQPPGETGMRPPRDSADLAALAVAAVRRYGPDGSFWRIHPRLPQRPIRAWQIWNEPNLASYWRPAPSARAYVAMLRTVRDAIHGADPGATVISAGLPDSNGGVDQLTYLRNLYKGGLHGAADAVAIHAYAPDVAGVVALVSKARQVMTRNGDAATPMWITEYGFATGGEASLFTVNEGEQAGLLTGATGVLRGLAAPLGIGGLFVFSWRDPSERFLTLDIWPYHAGLIRANGTPKPVLVRLARVLQAPVGTPPARPARLRMRTRVGPPRPAAGRAAALAARSARCWWRGSRARGAARSRS